MQFTYINFLPFLDFFKEKNLKVSFFINKRNLSYDYFEYEITSLLHHTDYIFPSEWKRDKNINIKNCSQNDKKDFLFNLYRPQQKEDESSVYILLKENENNFLLSSILKNENKISFNSVIHDQILNAIFMEDLALKCFQYYIANNETISPVIPAIFEYEIEKYYLENMDSMDNEEIQDNLKSLYGNKLNSIIGKLLSLNICPIEIMPVNPIFNSKIIEVCANWLDKNNNNESIIKVLNFFNTVNYKDLFFKFLKDSINRTTLENYIFAIDKNNDATFKDKVYQNFPFLKFELPNYIIHITDNEIQFNIAHILKQKNFTIFEDDTTKSNLYYAKKIKTSHIDNINNNLQKIINQCSKFYNLTPFKIKKIKGSILSFEVPNSNLKNNKEIGEFINIMFYELFILAKPIDNNIMKTLDSILPTIHKQVLDFQVPENVIKNHSINKF